MVVDARLLTSPKTQSLPTFLAVVDTCSPSHRLLALYRGGFRAQRHIPASASPPLSILESRGSRAFIRKPKSAFDTRDSARNESAGHDLAISARYPLRTLPLGKSSPSSHLLQDTIFFSY